MIIKAMRTTERGAHTWMRCSNCTTTLDQIVTRFSKLGDVKVDGTKITVKRFDGSKLKAEVFPA